MTKRVEKILLFLLVLIYLTNVYDRLVGIVPDYLIVSLGINQVVVLGSDSTSPHKSLIEHRRHLPLTKKLEIGNNSLVVNHDFSGNALYRKCKSLFCSVNEYLNSPLKDHPSNKAPPFAC
jgi:hypothetical protein